jgi:thioredoxin reductase (NADPH)
MATQHPTPHGEADDVDAEREAVLGRMVDAGIMREGVPRLAITGSGPASELRDFLVRNRIPFDFRPDPGSTELVRCDLPGAPSLLDPTLREVAIALGIYRTPSRDLFDVAIVGAGPAGLAAAVYAASEGLSTVLVERFAPGGQAGTTSRIENYLGFPDGISGAELAERSRDQALRFGVELLLVREVVDGGDADGGRHRLVLDDGTELGARVLVVATGVEWRKLDRPGVAEMLGRGVFYGAAAGEAPGLRDKHVVIIGAGNSAGQAAVFFADWAVSVTMIVRAERLSESMSAYLADRLVADPRITLVFGAVLERVEGDDWIRSVVVSTGPEERSTLPAGALFVCIGGEPRTEWARERGVQVDAAGYILTGSDLETDGSGRPEGWDAERRPFPLETSSPGMFAIGDVRANSTKRVSTAVGDGAMVVKLVHELVSAGPPEAALGASDQLDTASAGAEPLLVTVGRLAEILDPLNEELRARGRRVVGATSEAELRTALAGSDVSAVILGGGLSDADRIRYRQIVAEIQPSIPVHQHEDGGPHGLVTLAERVAAELGGSPRAPGEPRQP